MKAGLLLRGGVCPTKLEAAGRPEADRALSTPEPAPAAGASPWDAEPWNPESPRETSTSPWSLSSNPLTFTNWEAELQRVRSPQYLLPRGQLPGQGCCRQS